MKFSKVVIALCLLSTSVFGVDKVLKSLPIRTSLVAKFNLDEIKKIKFIKDYLADTNNIKVAELRSAIKGYTGLDIMSVKELWIATGTEEEMLFIARGGFSTIPVEQSLRKVNKYGDMKIPGVHFASLFDDESKPGKKNLIAILDDKTVILGDPKFGEKYLDVYTGKKTGVTATELKILEKLEKSTSLVHAKSLNLYIPPKEMNNPVLNNIKSADLVIDQNSKYLTAKLETEAKDTSTLNGVSLFLNGLIDNARKAEDPNQNPIVKEGLKYAKVRNSSRGLSLDTKFSLSTLELLLGDQLDGLEAIFE